TYLLLLSSLTEIIQRYHTYVELEANESNAICETEQQDHSKMENFLTVKELLHATERHLEDPAQLSRTDLVNLEDQLQGALLETRARKTHLMMADVTILKEKEKMLIEENRLLSEEIALAGKKTDEGNEETDGHLNQTPPTLKLF
ncbi:hypothetical protein Leryth_024953, partial [Lithospermum erythrorhizon]